MSTQYETRVVTYVSDRSAKSGIAKMESKGWEVVSVESIDRGYAKGKTCCLAILFFPLALLGKKPAATRVVYRKPK